MRLLYCDETNLEERSGDFLIYGGLTVSADQAFSLSRAIDALRRELRVPPDYRFKFNPGPVGFSHAQFIDLKRSAITLALEHGAQFLSYLVLHDIAQNPDDARRKGINTICLHFNYILNEAEQPGLVLIDRFNDQGNEIDAHLRDKFSVGLTGLPYSANYRLERIIGFHYSALGQSHLPSLVDIVLGTFRFAINAHTRGQTEHLATARELISLLSPLFWRADEGLPVPELGLMFSPKSIRAPSYRQQYQQLKDFFTEAGLETLQEITSDVTY